MCVWVGGTCLRKTFYTISFTKLPFPKDTLVWHSSAAAAHSIKKNFNYFPEFCFFVVVIVVLRPFYRTICCHFIPHFTVHTQYTHYWESLQGSSSKISRRFKLVSYPFCCAQQDILILWVKLYWQQGKFYSHFESLPPPPPLLLPNHQSVYYSTKNIPLSDSLFLQYRQSLVIPGHYNHHITGEKPREVLPLQTDRETFYIEKKKRLSPQAGNGGGWWTIVRL